MKTLIIAEAGVNHNGDINLAKQLIDVAAEAGADLVKFQTFLADDLVTQSAPKADYQIDAKLWLTRKRNRLNFFQQDLI
jgi:N,N'-diacetyllegionaminate synthase